MKLLLWRRLLGLALLLLIAACTGAAPVARLEQQAQTLERQLLAPCCFRETLEVHQSPVTTELRAEIRQRLGAGEPPAQVEAALVSRYGPRLRAHLPAQLGVWLMLAIGAAGWLVLWGLGRRWTRPTKEAAPPTVEPALLPADRAYYDGILDADLNG